MKQKIFTLFLALAASVGTINADVYSGKCGESLSWSLDTETGALVITGSGYLSLSKTYNYGWKDYATYVQSVVIPEGLTDMDDAAFGTCTNLKSVVWNAVWCDHFSAYNTAPFYEYGYATLKQITSFTFGENVQRIPAYLCDEMSSLTEVVIPSTVTIIGRCAFYGCKGLTEVVLPEGLTAMGSSAFASCSNLASVNIPKSLKEIYSYAFSDTALPSIELHDGITSIGDYAFARCPFTEVTIPAGVTAIGEAAFSGCSKLTKVVWNAVWCDHFSAYNTAPFYDYGYATLKQITSFTFGENVQRIPAYLCDEMSSLTEVVIPSTVTIIGKAAFYGCKGLTEVVLPEGLTAMGSSAFASCSNLASVNIPKSLKEIYSYAFSDTALPSIELHDGITSIGDYAFARCPFTELTIPAGVTAIGEAAFSGCSKLTKVVWNAVWCDHFSAYNTAPFYDYNYVTLKQITSFTFGPNVQRIPAYLCDEMSSLTEITIPSTVTIIGKAAFSGCKGLTEVVLPEGLTAMGASAFSNCSNLASVNIPTSLKEIYDYAFYATALTSIDLHDGITSIGDYAFAKCPFTVVTIPKGVTEMGEAPFSGCSKLTKVVWNAVWCSHFSAYNTAPFYDYNYVTLKQITSFTFGPNVQRIPAYLCNEMSSLTEIAIPATVTIIGRAAFSGCKGLTEVVLPEGLTAMGASAFSACSNLASVNIPKSLKEIYSYAFSGTALTSIDLHDKITSIGDRAFAQCPFTEVTIPAGVTEMGDAPFYGCSNLTKVTWNAVNCTTSFASNTHPFYGISGNITSVTFGDTIKTIPYYLCRDMTKLEFVSIPATVKNIRNYAFAYSGLKTIFNYASTPQSINANVFSGVDQVACSLYIPKSAMSLYEEAPVWKEFFKTEMDPIYEDLYETACDKFEWNEKVYTASQDVVETFKAKNGNDSIVTLHLTINYSNTGEETQTAIGSYEWQGETYTESGDYQYTLTNAAGCDSVATLHLTVIPVWEVTVVQPEHGTIACIEDIVLSHVTDKSTLHFEAYPDEGYAFEAWIGCAEDGTIFVTENVTVSCSFRPKTIEEEFYETACDKYEWDGDTYTASQNIVKTYKSAIGGDSIVTLHLTINYSNTGEETQEAIGSYEWNGTTYTESGDYQYTLTNAAGCDSVATLHLTVIPVWEVTVVQPEHGTIACIEDIVLSHVTDNSTLHFEAYPDEGYAFEAWIGCEEDGSLKVTENVTVSCTFKEDTPTGTGEVRSQKSDVRSQKILRDGQLYIMYDGRMYDVQGARVE